MSQLIAICVVLALVFTTQVDAQAATAPTCKDNFWWDGQKCDICGTGCRTCSSTLKCTECYEGRYMSGDMCMACGLDGVKQCCLVGNDAAALRATACYEGYKLQGSVCIRLDTKCTAWIDGTYICNKCLDGYYLDPYNVCVEGKETGCKTYINKDQCAVCKDGYYLFKKTDAADIMYMGCEKCNDFCKCSNETNKCSDCWDGPYYQSSEAGATTKACSKCPDQTGDNILASLKCDAKGCLTNGSGCSSNAICIADGGNHICRTLANCVKVSTDKDGIKCDSCKNGYYLKERGCQVCTTPVTNVEAEYTKCKSDVEFIQCQQTVWTIPFKDQQYIVTNAEETAKKICTANENNCKLMKDSQKECTACYDGWHLINGICKSCIVEIPNCTKCTVSGTGETAQLLCEACTDNTDNTNARNYFPKSDQTSCLEYPSQVLSCTTRNDDTAQLAGCSCVSNFKIKNGSESECVQCDDANCKSCGDKSVTGTAKCMSCFAGYGVIADKCEHCSYNCANCDKNRDVCAKCNAGYFLVENKYCSPKRDRCTSYDSSGCSVCEYNYHRHSNHCLRCDDMTIVTTATAAKNVGAYQRVLLADQCPKVDAKTCQAISPPNPSSASGSGSGASDSNILRTLLIVAALVASFAFIF